MAFRTRKRFRGFEKRAPGSPFTMKIFLTRLLSESWPINKLWNDEKIRTSSSVSKTNNALSSQSDHYKAA